MSGFLINPFGFNSGSGITGTVVLLMPLDGDATDSTSRHTPSNTGVAFNTVTPPPFQSESGDFDGTSDYITVADDADFHQGSDDFTVELYVRQNIQVTNALITKWGPSNREWALFMDSNGDLEFLWSTDGSNSFDVTYAIPSSVQNTWVHVAISRVGNTFYLCLDEEIVATGDATGVTINESTRDVVVGANNAGASAELTGRMAQVRIIQGQGLYSGSVSDPITVNPPFSTS